MSHSCWQRGVWQATFDSPGLNGLAQFISRTADGGFVVVGVLNGPGSSNALVLRLNDFGGLIWQKAFGGPYDDGLSSVRETSDGGFVLAGQFQPLGGCIACTDAWVLRLDGSGNLLWSKTYGGTDEDRLYEIEELPGGRFVAAGATRSSGAGAFDAFAILLDAGGNIVWQKGHAAPTTPAPVATSSSARSTLTRFPFSSPRKANPPPAPQQRERLRARGGSMTSPASAATSRGSS